MEGETRYDKRIRAIFKQVSRLATGDYSVYVPVSDKLGEIDAISVALNHLSASLEEHERFVKSGESRLEDLLRVANELGGNASGKEGEDVARGDVADQFAQAIHALAIAFAGMLAAMKPVKIACMND